MIDWKTTTFEANPIATDLVGQTYAFIQTTRVAVGERLRVEHDMDDTHGTSGQGVHTMGSARAFIVDAATASPPASPALPVYVLADGPTKGRIAFKRIDEVLDGSSKTFYKTFFYYKDGTASPIDAWVEPSYMHLGDVDDTAYGLKTFFEWPMISDITGVAKASPYSTYAAATKTLVPIASLEARLEAFQDTMLASILPVGFSYAQYPGCKTPIELWGATFGALWTEQSFAGAFFRATGGAALAFDGGEQGQQLLSHAHTITHTAEQQGVSASATGPSPGIDRGTAGATFPRVVLPGSTDVTPEAASTENRPRNYTIRIWKRTGE